MRYFDHKELMRKVDFYMIHHKRTMQSCTKAILKELEKPEPDIRVIDRLLLRLNANTTAYDEGIRIAHEIYVEGEPKQTLFEKLKDKF